MTADRTRSGAGGGLLLDKPTGPTSHDMVALARKVLGERRIGHTGTLDPFASGLLLLLVGRTTRLAEYLHELPKEYEAEARLGQSTTTDDLEGEVTAESDGWRTLGEAEIRDALAGFRGEIDQLPPAFSAKKISGEAAYRRARRGEAVTLKPARVRIHELELEAAELPRIRFRVVCSTGTYVRSLARDLGDALGVGAHLTGLRRTRIGSFSVENAAPPEELKEGGRASRGWVEPLELVSHLPRCEVGEGEARRLAAGQAVPAGENGEGLVAVASGGALVAVARREGSRLRPRKVFLDG